MPDAPTVDAYFKAAHDLAALIRKALDGQKIKKGDIRKALDAFEKVDFKAM